MADIRKVVGLVQQKYPGVRQILLMPVVGAPEGQCQNVRAASNYPTVVEAIGTVAGEGIVRAGAAPVVADCSWFLGRLGHLTADAAASIKQQLQDHYRERLAKCFGGARRYSSRAAMTIFRASAT